MARARLRKKRGEKVEKRNGNGNPKKALTRKTKVSFAPVKGGGYCCNICGMHIPQGETNHHKKNCVYLV